MIKFKQNNKILTIKTSKRRVILVLNTLKK
jgi:hypothetical protein